jgi:hypothetical protein
MTKNKIYIEIFSGYDSKDEMNVYLDTILIFENNDFTI